MAGEVARQIRATLAASSPHAADRAHRIRRAGAAVAGARGAGFDLHLVKPVDPRPAGRAARRVRGDAADLGDTADARARSDRHPALTDTVLHSLPEPPGDRGLLPPLARLAPARRPGIASRRHETQADLPRRRDPAWRRRNPDPPIRSPVPSIPRKRGFASRAKSPGAAAKAFPSSPDPCRSARRRSKSSRRN